MKTYVFVDESTGAISVAELEETHPEVQEGQIFQELLDDQSKLALRYEYKDGAILNKYPNKTDEEVLESILLDQKQAAIAEELDELSQAKKSKLLVIRTHYNDIVESLKKDVAQYEVATWDVQRIEYADWLKDKTAKIPYVTALAAGRGISVEVLMEKIGYRVSALANLQGMQQALEVKVQDCATVAEVDAIPVG